MYYICNFAGRKDLIGEDNKRFQNILSIWGIIKDINSIEVMACYNPKYKELIEGALENSAKKLDYISKFLGNKDYLTGKISAADFFLCEILSRRLAISGEKGLD